MVTIEDLKHALNLNDLIPSEVLTILLNNLLKSLPMVLVSASRDELSIYITTKGLYFGTSKQLFINDVWCTRPPDYKSLGNRLLKIGNIWDLLLEYATEHGYI